MNSGDWGAPAPTKTQDSQFRKLVSGAFVGPVLEFWRVGATTIQDTKFKKLVWEVLDGPILEFWSLGSPRPAKNQDSKFKEIVWSLGRANS